MSVSYRPGTGYAVVGDAMVLMLPDGARARAAQAWQLLDAGADPDLVLDQLLAEGLSTLTGLAALSRTESGIRVLLRGEATAVVVTAEGQRDLDAGAATTWTEHAVADPREAYLACGETLEGPELRLDAGLVRAGAVAWTPAEVESAQPAAPGEGAEPVEPPELPDAELPGGEPELPELTSYRPVDLPTDVIPVAEPGPQEAPGPAGRAVARLTFSDGRDEPVDGVLIVGRAPRTTDIDAQTARAISVPSPHHEVSANHIEIRPGLGADLGAAVVTDLGSTNGTVLVQPGLPPEELRPGVPVQLLPGALIDLGDGATIQVRRAG